jgi:hypothetical protein
MPATTVEPLNVPVRKVGPMCGHGHDKTYKLIKDGEYKSFVDGGQRMVTMASIKARQARLIAETGGAFTPAPFRGQPDGLAPKHRRARAAAEHLIT